MNDSTRLLLFIALSLAVLVLVSDRRRPLAGSPIAGDTVVGESNDARDPGLVTSAQFANVPSNSTVPPLNLMMPVAGVQPYGDDNAG